jgi:hypothetical protein
MPVGSTLELRQPTSTGEAQVRYQIRSLSFFGNSAAVVGEVVHDTPAEAASDLFVKAKFTVNGEVRETTQQIPLGNKEVIEIERTLDNVPPNAEVGFAVQAAEPGTQISDSLIFYDFVTAAEDGTAPSLQPEAVEAGIESLRMEPGGATLTPGEERTLVIEGITADGTTFPLTDGLSFTSSNPGVVTVSADGRLEAFGRGSAAVTATFDGGIGEPSITENFTVEPPDEGQPEEPGPGPGPAPAPEEPEPINPELPNLNPEPGVYVLPFSVLNAAPFLQGVPDVTIRIPTELSIESIVDRVTLSQSEAEAAARDGVDVPEPADPPAEDDIFAEFTDGEPFNSVPTLEELRTETQDAVDSIDIPEPPAVEDITDPVDSTIDALQEDLESFIDDTETFLDDSISATEAVIDDTLDGIDSAVGDVQDSIDTALADIDSGFSDVQDTLAETQESIPSLEDIVADTTAAVITEIEAQIIPTQEGVLLTDDPPRFFAIAIENFLDEALSAATKQRARERAQEGQ